MNLPIGLFFLALLLASPAAATDPDVRGMEQVFKEMEKALKKGDERAFKKRWTPRAYQKNLVGGSGLSGRAVFGQGSTESWFLKPNFKTLAGVTRGEPWIVRCAVWSWKRQKALDEVWAVFATHDKVLKLLGAGEKKAEVFALARRWVKKQPLEP